MKQIIKEIIIILQYDLKIFFRYKSNVIWLIATPVVFMLVGTIILNIMGVERFVEYSGGVTSGSLYTMVGYGVFSLANYCWQAGQKIENEMVVGTMKTNFLLPIHRLSYVYGLSLSTMCSTGIFSIVILVIAGVITGTNNKSLGIAIIAFILSVGYFLGIAVIMCSLSLRYKKIGGLANLLTFLLQLITGMMIPIPAFPKPLKIVCYLSPTTWAIDSIRSGILDTNSLIPITYEIMILFCSSILCNMLGWWLFKTSERYINENGEIEGY